MRERVVLPHLTPSEIPETMVNEATRPRMVKFFSTTSTNHVLVLLLLLSYNREKNILTSPLSWNVLLKS